MKVIILAQGKGSRWNINLRGLTVPSEYKQLIPLQNGETLLSRTMRQLKELEAPYPTLIASYAAFGHLGTQVSELREPVGSIIQGIISLRHLWMNEKDILFILGDVVFSNIMLYTIVKHELPGIWFYGRHGENVVTGKAAKEIFALRVSGDSMIQEEFWSKLLELIADTSTPEKLKLWDFHNFLHLSRTGASFLYIKGDYTDDVDSLNDYKEFFSKLDKAVSKDDKDGSASPLLCS